MDQSRVQVGGKRPPPPPNLIDFFGIQLCIRLLQNKTRIAEESI